MMFVKHAIVSRHASDLSMSMNKKKVDMSELITASFMKMDNVTGYPLSRQDVFMEPSSIFVTSIILSARSGLVNVKSERL